jgi:hypothetical protein
MSRGTSSFNSHDFRVIIVTAEMGPHQFLNGYSIDGYAARDGRTLEGTLVQLILASREDADIEGRPLDPLAFRGFASVVDLDSALSFANMHGLLGHSPTNLHIVEVEGKPHHRVDAETVEGWLTAAQKMREAIDLWEMVRVRRSAEQWKKLLSPYLQSKAFL